MSRKNDITGAELVTKANTKEYAEGYDRIFGKPKERDPLAGTLKCLQIEVNGKLYNVGNPSMTKEKILKLAGMTDGRVTFRRGGYDVGLNDGESMPVFQGQRFFVKER